MTPGAPVPLHEADRLKTLRSYCILDTPPEQAYDDVTAIAASVCGTTRSLLTFVDETRQWFKSEQGLGLQETSRANAFCAFALERTDALIVEDALLDERFRENPLVLGPPGIRFYAGAPLVAPDGNVLGTVCVFDTEPRSLSGAQVAALEALARQTVALLELAKATKEKEAATRALLQREKLAAVGRLASSMAHEINNPLEAVTNLLYLARNRAFDAQVREWLEQAEGELQRISLVATQALGFHRQSTKPRLMTCLDLFSATMRQHGARMANAGITVEKRKRADTPVECFEGDIRQMLGNLIANAVDAMPSGGRLLLRSRCGTDWRTGRKGVVLTLADTGTGMDAGTRSRIFEAFFSTKGIGGAGLGLWISADIMQRHEGRLLVRSSQGAGHCGTVVAIFLPFQRAGGGAMAVTKQGELRETASCA